MGQYDKVWDRCEQIWTGMMRYGTGVSSMGQVGAVTGEV